MEVKEGLRRTSSLHDDVLRALVEENPRTTIRGLAGKLDVSKSTVDDHLIAIRKVKKLESGFLTHFLIKQQPKKSML